LPSSWTTPHLRLPPFPARRSSDLHDLELDKPAIEGGKRVLQHRRAGHQFLPVPHGETLFRGKRGVAAGKGVGKVDLVGSQRVKRSEEHTSELQSRENLVCRLLLEK